MRTPARRSDDPGLGDRAEEAAGIVRHALIARASGRSRPEFPLRPRLVDAQSGIGQEGEGNKEENEFRKLRSICAEQDEARKQRRDSRVIGPALHEAELAGPIAPDMLECECGEHHARGHEQRQCAMRRQPPFRARTSSTPFDTQLHKPPAEGHRNDSTLYTSDAVAKALLGRGVALRQQPIGPIASQILRRKVERDEQRCRHARNQSQPGVRSTT